MKDNNLYFEVVGTLFSIYFYKIFNHAITGRKVQVFAYVSGDAVVVVDVWLRVTQKLGLFVQRRRDLKFYKK